MTALRVVRLGRASYQPLVQEQAPKSLGSQSGGETKAEVDVRLRNERVLGELIARPGDSEVHAEVTRTVPLPTLLAFFQSQGQEASLPWETIKILIQLRPNSAMEGLTVGQFKQICWAMRREQFEHALVTNNANFTEFLARYFPREARELASGNPDFDRFSHAWLRAEAGSG